MEFTYKCVMILLISITYLSLVRSFPSHKFDVQDLNLHSEETYRLPNNTIPIHYDIKLIPHIVEGNFTFDGATDIQFEVLNPSYQVILHYMNLTIYEERTAVSTEYGTTFRIVSQTYDEETNFVYIQTEEELPTGIYTLHFEYKGFIRTDYSGFHKSRYINNNNETVWLTATHFEPFYARSVFPCWDEPALKATYNLSIKHYTNYTALSNMPVKNQSVLDEMDKKIWTHFEKTPIMSTYLLAFVISDFVQIPTDDPTISIWCRRNVVEQVNLAKIVIPNATRILEEYTQKPVGVPKMDHVAVPQYRVRATEHWGLITYAESAILYDEKFDDLKTKIMNAMTMAHELAHQWFGNLVTPSWWKYLWLSEGFSVYYQHYTINKIFPEWRLEESFVTSQLQMQAFSFDIDLLESPLNQNVNNHTEIVDMFSVITYSKGGCITRMLTHCLSNKVFHNAMLNFLEEHKYNSVTSDDLWAALQSSLNNSISENDISQKYFFNVKEAMDDWVYQSGYPLITVKRINNTEQIEISQESFVSDHKDDKISEDLDSGRKWSVPLNYAIKSNADFSSTLPTHWLKKSSEKVTIENIPIDDWIIVNKQLTGYYRVNYDDDNWRKIAEQLNSPNYTDIHVLNRAQIIDDSIELVKIGKIDFDTYMHIIKYLSNERDLIPWLAVLESFNSMKHYLVFPELYAIVEPHMLHLMDNVVEDALSILRNTEYNVDDASKLRITNLLGIACYLNHPKCTEYSIARLMEALDNDTELSYDQGWEIICMGLRNANETIWNRVLDKFFKTKSLEYLEYLSCSNNHTIISNFLNMTKDPLNTVPFDASFWSIYDNADKHREILVNFVLDNIKMVFSREGTEYGKRILKQLLTMATTHQQIDRIKQIQQEYDVSVNSFRIDYSQGRLKMINQVNYYIKKLRNYFDHNIQTDVKDIHNDIPRGVSSLENQNNIYHK